MKKLYTEQNGNKFGLDLSEVAAFWLEFVNVNYSKSGCYPYYNLILLIKSSDYGSKPFERNCIYSREIWNQELRQPEVVFDIGKSIYDDLVKYFNPGVAE